MRESKVEMKWVEALKAVICSAIIFASVAAFAPKSYAISRVGNRTLQDDRAEAEFDVSSSFPGISEITQSRVRLQGIGIRPNYGEVRDFLVEYPSWKDLSRQEFQETMRHLEWEPLHLNEIQNPCVELYSAVQENTLTYIATWGEGSGFVFISPSSAQSRNALLDSLSTLHFSTESCHWKLTQTPK